VFLFPHHGASSYCDWRKWSWDSTWTNCNRLHLKCDDTRAETSFRLSAKRTSPFKSAGASVQSTTGSRGVRISGSHAGYYMFRDSVKSYWLPTPFASFPFPSPPVRHRVPSHFNWTLPCWRWNRQSHLVTRNACVVHLQLWTADSTWSLSFWFLQRANTPCC
jgi:hypothetical protein